jgi:hypothetical protein
MRFDVPGANNDRILYWPLILAVAGPLVFLLVWISIAALGNPIILLLLISPILILIPLSWAGAGIFAVMTCIVWIYERAWRRFASTLILPLVVVLAGLNLERAWRATQTAGDYVHLYFLYPSLLADIEKLPADKPRFMVWDWAPVWTREIGIAYDDSAEIASDHPSEAWKQRAKQVGVLGYGYRPLHGHFYLVDLE